MKNKLVLFAIAGLLAAGCKSNPTPKASHERGWIGGDYRRAERKLVPKGEHSAVYVKQVYPGTPAEQAGLKPADLILAVKGNAVTSIKEFRRLVDAATPGSHATVRVLRDDLPLELPLTVGRETYQEWHAFTVGLGFSTQVDLWPNPEFSVMPVAQYKHPQCRVELRSPETVLASQAARSKGKNETGTYSGEGWDAWFLLFGVNAHKQILKQELVQVP
jgi:membrane-associated protease RseP (regulator of RpoE activity)